MQWSKPATARARQVEGEFSTHLRQISDALAGHDQAASVSPAQVNRAFEALAISGLRRRRWIDRPESESSVGAFLIGFAFSCPGVVATLFEDKNKSIATTSLLVAFIVGVFFVAHGWYRGRLPAAPVSKSSFAIWGRRILLTLVMAGIIAAIGYTVYVRFIVPMRAIQAEPGTAATDAKNTEKAPAPKGVETSSPK